MRENEIINLLKPIVEEIVPSSELIFKEAVYKLFSADIDEENLTLGFAKFINRKLDYDFPEIDQKFPEIFKTEKYERWYFQILSIIFENTLKNITENTNLTNGEKITELQEVIYFLKDIEFTHPIMSEYFTRFYDYCERKIASLNPVNSKNDPAQLYYWPHSSDKLKKLEYLLEINQIIEHNPNFGYSFSVFNLLPKYRTKWKLKQRDLFALLYLIFNKEIIFKNENMSVITI